ncbi:replication-relaxation family protein [Microtetraspora fusca]|uniref:Replication-relaxation family protein n=1 Tax=Microtetraspora fusca TaxID=1997 RepID=A0ABW6VI08_MICFU
MSARRIQLGQPRVEPAALAELAARLTERDYKILDCVHEHRVLTTHQIQKMFFTLPQPTRRRLGVLHRLGALARFRPWTPYGGGSSPGHWVLGRAGAAALAASRNVTVAELGYRHDTAIAICFSSRLHHQVGVNDFFADLHAHARRSAGKAEVRKWWPERRCIELWGDLARPDAYGRWTENSRELDFFLEHDTGTEPLTKVAAKLGDYANLAEATGITTPVLIWLPGHTRETHLRELLTDVEVPVATAVRTSLSDGPAGAVWLPAGATSGRLRLAELAHAWPDLNLNSARSLPFGSTAAGLVGGEKK